MSGIDDRVVSMKFDNESFERKLGDTLKSLEKLKHVEFDKPARGLSELSAAGKSFNMQGMVGAVEGVSSKFLALSTIGITALATLTTHAVSAAAKIVSSFTLKPIMEGFGEYETQLNSVQTILANTASRGTSLNQVNDALQKLNEYSDKTIYNFGQMARNIGTFTAAGVDLDTSVSSIKGIANLAAMSGSTSEQASTAMYQLSQAIAAGSVKLMDWNSVVNAGMGGEAFKSALFETGKVMGTLADVPMTQSFTEWEDAGNSFRETLQDGWITADVLTTTLGAFTGDMTKEMLVQKGFNEQQADAIMKQAAMALSAAQEVKTFTQLMGTLKEAVGTGWADSFKLLIGNFEEAKQLWTGVNNAVGGFINRSSEARNELLRGWRFLGGRDVLINALEHSFGALAKIVSAVGRAFRSIFPPMTAEKLMALTQGFEEFSKKLDRLAFDAIVPVTRLFKGLFAIVSIGWEVIKGVVGLFGDLFSVLGDAAGKSDIMIYFNELITYILKLHEILVTNGGIAEFFDKLSDAIKNPGKYIDQLKDKLVDFFDKFPWFSGVSDGVQDAIGRVGDRLSWIRDIVDNVSKAWDWLTDRLEGVRNALSTVWQGIKDWFGELKDKMATVLQPSDFDGAVDAVNVGLLGGIALMLKKFLSGGFKGDLGGGLVDKIKDTFDGLTSTLKTMQADLKAKALQKIAVAVAILTASVVALSMIDSAALTKALIALSVSFGQLFVMMKALDKLDISGGVSKLPALAGAMILLATAVTILSVAIKILSTMGWEELAKGLGGVAVGLVILTKATQLVSADASGLIRAGIAIGAMAAAMLILSYAVKSFSDMSWEELGKGLLGVAGGLALLVAATNLMPPGPTLAAGLAMIPLAVGLNILAGAVKLFSMMEWGEMGKGLAGIAGALGVIALTMSFMPISMPITAAGVLILSNALIVMAGAVKLLGSIKMGELAKGIGGFAIMLGVLAAAMLVMSGTLAGAAAMVVAAGALVILTGVLMKLSQLSIGELAMGLGAMAGVFVILGAAGLVLGLISPLLLAVGAALIMVGAGFAAFGVGAILVAKAFEIMAVAGKAGTKAIIESINLLIGAMPAFVAALILAIVQFIKDLGSAAVTILKTVTVVVSQILDTVIKLIPKFAEAIGKFIGAGIMLIREYYPDLLKVGFEILLNLLRGISEHIEEITTLAVDIITKFTDTLTENMPKMVESAVGLIVAFITGITDKLSDITTAGVGLLVAFLLGISNEISKVVEAVGLIITTYLDSVSDLLDDILDAGVELLVEFLKGIGNNLKKVTDGVVEVVTEFIDTLGDNQRKIFDSGFKVLTDMLSGIGKNLIKVVETVGQVIGEFISAVGKKASDLATAGADALVDFLDGIGSNILRVISKGVEIAGAIISGVGSQALQLASAAAQALVDFLNGLAAVIREKDDQIKGAGRNVASAIISGITGGMSDKAADIGRSAVNIVTGAIGSAIRALNPFSKSVGDTGKMMTSGLSNVFAKDTSVSASVDRFGSRVTASMRNAFSHIPDALSGLDEFNPVITPVLDLTLVRNQARTLRGYIPDSSINANVSYSQARDISVSEELAAKKVEDPTYAGPRDVTFEQNIFAPTQLNANDIYRNTKSQLALAKERLKIA